jgi:hypothetical protein
MLPLENLSVLAESLLRRRETFKPFEGYILELPEGQGDYNAATGPDLNGLSGQQPVTIWQRIYDIDKE